MRKVLSLYLLLVIAFSGCSKTEDTFKLSADSPAYKLAKDVSAKLADLDPDKNKVLVDAKSFKITAGEVIVAIQRRYGKQSASLNTLPEDRIKGIVNQTLNGLVNQKLIINEAEAAHVTVSQAEVDSVLDMTYNRFGGKEKYIENLVKNDITVDIVQDDIKKSLIMNRYLDEILAKEIEVTDEDIQTAYNEDKTATVRHILLQTKGKSDEEKKEIRSKMEEILARAKKGEDFAELAKQNTEDPGSKESGGLYENFPKGQMVKEFEDAAFNVPIGEVSDIVETTYGYHILKIIDRKKETKPLDEVKDQISKQLTQTKKNKAYFDLVDKLRAEAGVEMNEL